MLFAKHKPFSLQLSTQVPRLGTPSIEYIAALVRSVLREGARTAWELQELKDMREELEEPNLMICPLLRSMLIEMTSI